MLIKPESYIALIQWVVDFFKSYKYQIITPVLLVFGGFLAFTLMTEGLPFDTRQVFGEFRMFRYIAF